MGFENIHTHVPKLNQCSTYEFKVGCAVVSIAILVEAANPSSEHRRAVYLGTAAEYASCVSLVAMPSSSSYRLDISSGRLSLAFDVTLLEVNRTVGMEVKKINIKATKPTMAEGLGEGSMMDKGGRKTG